MNPFYTIKASGHDATRVINDCLSELEAAPAEYNFGFLYASDQLAEELEGLVQRCRFKTGIQHWVGSLGVAIIAGDDEIYDTPAISIMLCRFEEDQFTVLPTVKDTGELATNLNLPDLDGCYFALLHVDGYNETALDMLEDLGKAATNMFIAGGITSSRSAQLQIADSVASDGISGVIFDDSVSVLTNLTQGCSPLGEKHAVTSCQENIAITLDDRPALKVLYEDIGEILSRDMERTANYIFTGICIPHSDISDYRVRQLIGIDEEQKIFGINDHLTQGDHIIFCKRDAESAGEDMKAMLETMKRRIKGTIRGGVYISCLGRGREQFGDHSEEIGMIRSELGDFPLVGFFANGEIHNSHVYGYTGVLTLFLSDR